MSDINTAAVDGLKALDSDRPIREADIPDRGGRMSAFGGKADIEI